jgi:hypothetical protein
MRSTAATQTSPSVPPQGWRGGARLALDVLVTGLIVSVVLSLAVVSVAAHAQDAAVAIAAAQAAPGLDWLGLSILGLMACALTALPLMPRRQQRPFPVLPEQALRRRAEMAGWVC